MPRPTAGKTLPKARAGQGCHCDEDGDVPLTSPVMVANRVHARSLAAQQKGSDTADTSSTTRASRVRRVK